MLYVCLPQAGALHNAVCRLWLEERTPEQLEGEGD
jgi:hypothetical protein